MQEAKEMLVWSLDSEDPLEEEMATWSSILAWKIPWTEETGELQSVGSQRVGHYWAWTRDRKKENLAVKIGLMQGSLIHCLEKELVNACITFHIERLEEFSPQWRRDVAQARVRKAQPHPHPRGSERRKSRGKSEVPGICYVDLGKSEEWGF